MKVGEALKTQNGKVVLKSKDLIQQPQTVYNLEIYRDHNYSVSADRVLVHNTGCDDFLKNPKSTWGKSAEDIAQVFNDAGYEAIVEQSTKGSQLSKQVRIKGHNINNIQVHPGGGTHGGAYYKISTSNQGVIKVAEKATYHNNRGIENAAFHWIDD